MQKLLKAYLDILMRRQGPDILPDATFLLTLAASVYIAGGLLGLVVHGVMGADPLQGVGAVLFDAGFLCLWIWVMLKVAGHPARLRQTLSAALGCGAIIGLLSLPVVAVLAVFSVPPPASEFDATVTGAPAGPSAGGIIASLAVLVYLLLLGWYATVLGHIFSRALVIHAYAGIALGVMYVLASYLLVVELFPLDS